MRPALVFFLALLVAAPASLVIPEAGEAEARSRKARSKKKARPAKKPVIKLKEADTSSADTSAPTQGPPQRGPTRIDFDDRLIQGQTNKSGSVYLYDRKELKTRSMVKKRESFREEIVDAVYDSEK